MALAALKNFQELLFGRTTPQNHESGGASRGGRATSVQHEECALPLPDALWIVSWSAWMRIARAVVSPTIAEKSLFDSELPTEK